MNKNTIYLPELAQLQELIDFYHTNLLLAYEHFYFDTVCLQFFKDMLHSLEICRQISVAPHHKPAALSNGAYYFPWFITFQFFPATFDCIENMLGQLLHNSATAMAQTAGRQSLGKSYRLWTKEINLTSDYAASFDLLDTLHSRLIHQHDTFSQHGNIAITTYHYQSFVTTYGFSVELVNPQLLFALLKDIGQLFFTVYSKAKCSLSSM